MSPIVPEAVVAKLELADRIDAEPGSMGGEAGGVPGSIRLESAGLTALGRALEEAGPRRGAYDLLAADALLTYACEVALDGEEPEAALLRTARRVSAAEDE